MSAGRKLQHARSFATQRGIGVDGDFSAGRVGQKLHSFIAAGFRPNRRWNGGYLTPGWRLLNWLALSAAGGLGVLRLSLVRCGLRPGNLGRCLRFGWLLGGLVWNPGFTHRA